MKKPLDYIMFNLFGSEIFSNLKNKSNLHIYRYKNIFLILTRGSQEPVIAHLEKYNNNRIYTRLKIPNITEFILPRKYSMCRTSIFNCTRFRKGWHRNNST
jgi:hypothetical protein